MNFDYSDEQQMLKDGVSRFAQKTYTFEHRRALRSGDGFARTTWETFAELGWLAAGVPESSGGLGFGPVESAILAEELGRGLVVEPFLACGVLPVALVRHVASADQQPALLEPLASAAQVIAVAHSEAQARGNVSWVTTSAMREGAGWRLQGRKTLVVGAPVADRFIVVARTSGESDAHEGLSCFVVDAQAVGMRVEPFKLVDGGPAGELVLDGVQVGQDALLGTEGAALEGLQHAIDEAIVVQCAEVLGGMEDVLALCSEYLKTRKQFGVPIGSFQALQHRMADMAIELMQARGSLQRGLAALAEQQADRSRTVSGCKAQVIRSAKFVTAQGIQLHGGYGITEEYRVGHHYRRLLQQDAIFGGMEFHLRRYAAHIQKTAVAV